MLSFLFLRNNLIEVDSHYGSGSYVKNYRYFGSLENLIENERELLAKLAAAGGECECNDYIIRGISPNNDSRLDLNFYDYVIHRHYSTVETKDAGYYDRFPYSYEFDIREPLIK